MARHSGKIVVNTWTWNLNVFYVTHVAGTPAANSFTDMTETQIIGVPFSVVFSKIKLFIPFFHSVSRPILSRMLCLSLAPREC